MPDGGNVPWPTCTFVYCIACKWGKGNRQKKRRRNRLAAREMSAKEGKINLDLVLVAGCLSLWCMTRSGTRHITACLLACFPVMTAISKALGAGKSAWSGIERKNDNVKESETGVLLTGRGGSHIPLISPHGRFSLRGEKLPCWSPENGQHDFSDGNSSGGCDWRGGYQVAGRSSFQQIPLRRNHSVV